MNSRERASDLSSANSSEILATRVGLSFPGRALSFDEWQQAGLKIARMANSVAWFLGDWIIYGESQYVDRYQRAVEAAGLSYQTLRNYAWVARRFPLSRRRDKLTFYHHMEVARLSSNEQEQWLDRACEERWSVRQLRQSIRQDDRIVAVRAADGVILPQISADLYRVSKWRAAAEKSNKEFENWIVSSLDNAAIQDLDDGLPGL